MLANNIIRQFFTQIVGLIVGFIISIITTRILGAEGRGDFALIINTSAFLSLLLSFSFGTALIHVTATDKVPLRNAINSITVIIIFLILICVLTLAFIPFSKYNFLLPSDQNKVFNITILIVLFTTSLTSILFNSVLNGKKQFKKQQTMYFWIAPLSLAAYLILFYFKSIIDIDFKFFILFYIAINAVPAISAYIIYTKYVRPPFSFSFLNSAQLKYILNFSFIAYVANIFQFLSYRMDFWFVQYYSGTKPLGIYSLSVNLAQMLWLLPQAIATIFLAYSGSGNSKVAISQTNALSRITLNIILVVTVILASTINFIIPFLYGVEFKDSVFLFQLLLIGIVPFCITTIIAAYFAGKGKIKVNLYCSLIGFIVCLIFDLILIPRYGNIGAAIATIISYFTSTVYIVLVYLQKTRSPISAIIFIRKQDIMMLKNKLKSIF